MFVLASKHRALQARYEKALEDRDQFEAELNASRSANSRLAENYTHLYDTGEPMPMFTGPSKAQQLTARLHRVVRALKRYRTDAAQNERTIRSLQARLDSALGLDSPAIDEGRYWQARRHDKPRGVVGS